MQSSASGSGNGVKEQVQRAVQAALNLLFPVRCVVCGRADRSLCEHCASQFQVPGPNVCGVCFERIPGSGVCARCQSHPPHFESLRSAFCFEGGIREAIHALKYKRRRDVSAPLMDVAARHFPRPPANAILLAVPMHPSRLAERGYNHAGVLASDLARLWSMDAPISAALIRIRATGQQVGQDYLARQANMQNAFAADSALLGGRPVLILDDVCTTGATLNACAQAVLEAGAARVNCLTIARA